MENMKKFFITLILIILIGYVFFYLWQQLSTIPDITQNPVSIGNYVNISETEKVRKVVPLPSYKKEIPVRAPVALSGASRQEVFNLRKEAVAESPFAQKDYRPLDAVFGQIVSGKPWYALNLCRSKKQASTTGVSEETRFINNPTALVALEPAVIFFTDTKNWCLRDDYNTIMQKITFDGPNKEITVTYLDLPLSVKGNDDYNLNGINARDLGYPFVYVDKNRSTYKISFRQKDNVSTEVYEFRNYLHLGNSCGVKGGCNNGSSNQPKINFKKDSKISTKPREIYVKLWKKRPSSPEAEPDLVERIIILPKKR